MPIDPEFERLVKEFLTSVLTSRPRIKDGTAGDDALAAWLVRMFPMRITSMDARRRDRS